MSTVVGLLAFAFIVGLVVRTRWIRQDPPQHSSREDRWEADDPDMRSLRALRLESEADAARERASISSADLEEVRTVRLTKQQREFAIAGIELFCRTDPRLAAHFVVDGSSLRFPHDSRAVMAYAAYGLWKIEFVLDDKAARGEISPIEKASHYRSLRTLENKMHAALD